MSKRRKHPRYEPVVYPDDPDAIATVNTFDEKTNQILPIEIGFYWHESKGRSRIILNNDP